MISPDSSIGNISNRTIVSFGSFIDSDKSLLGCAVPVNRKASPESVVVVKTDILNNSFVTKSTLFCVFLKSFLIIIVRSPKLSSELIALSKFHSPFTPTLTTWTVSRTP